MRDKPFRVFLWALTLGSIGFFGGFYGPMYFAPGANQGPMLGIFLTGPAAIILGIILGLATNWAGLKDQAHAYALIFASLIVATITVSLSMPGPRYIGYVIDAEVRGCKQPRDLIEDSVIKWKNTKDDPKGWYKRPGWESDVNQMMKKDVGVVLDMWVYRERKLYKQEKPWNRGRIDVTTWTEVNKQRNFYARFSGGSCSKYNHHSRQIYFPKWEVSEVNPPDVLPQFLGLFVLGSVPSEYQSLIGN